MTNPFDEQTTPARKPESASEEQTMSTPTSPQETEVFEHQKTNEHSTGAYAGAPTADSGTSPGSDPGYDSSAAHDPGYSTQPGYGSSGYAGDYSAPTQYSGATAPAPPKGPRMRTVAWGLVLALLGVVVIAVGLGVQLDLELVFIGILGVAGVTLLVGSLLSINKHK